MAQYFERVTVFRDRYDSFISNSSLSHTLSMLRSARSLHDSILADRGVLWLISSNLIPGEAEIGADEERMTISFAESFDLAEIAAKLANINVLYATIRSLLGGNENDHPLRVLKVETGSLTIDAAGWASVIIILIPLLRGAALFLYRSKTIEGRTDSWIRDQVRAQNIQVDLSKRLRELNLDHNAVDRGIEETAEVITTNLLALVNSKSLSVNGRPVETGLDFALTTNPVTRALPLQNPVESDQKRLPAP